MNRDQVLSLVEATLEVAREDFRNQIQALNQSIQELRPPTVETYQPVNIVAGVISRQTDLNLIKSLPEFKGGHTEYPAWREAANFAINYYTVGSESYYIAMGILRNKITGSANENLSSFNTPLNFKAIIAKLDQIYSDKRPLHILENELNTLRQGRQSINEYYDSVDKQLTLILNKNIMTYSGNEVLTKAFNERARENALRVFISGLKRPLCDTLFSVRPKDLPSALATAQELEHNRQRYDFANTVANAKLISRLPNVNNQHNNMSPTLHQNTHQHMQVPQNIQLDPPVPMEVDPRTSYFRKPTNHQIQTAQQHRSNIQQQQRQFQQQNANNFQKRTNIGMQSAQSPQRKIQKINVMQQEILNQDENEIQYFSDIAEESDEDYDDIALQQLNFFDQKSHLPFITRTTEGQVLRILLDTGTAKNYIKKLESLKYTPVQRPFLVKSINGSTKISQKCELSVFNRKASFFILPTLDSFDGIIGYDFLQEIEGVIDTKNGFLFHKNGKEKLNHLKCQEVNLITDTVEKLVTKNIEAFAHPNRALPYHTSVVAKINLTTDKPVYSRSYPYPMSAAEFINAEIESLLRDNIIRKSSSQFNAPVHVVNKKGVDENGKPKLRMVIDFRKLNNVTITDKYPMPDMTVILSNLKKSKFFTTLDLKSGFYQINLHEADRHKTAFSVNHGKYEFCRLPFGWKNSAAIFQRAIDDILRDDIGKICHVYVDDIIVFSEDESSHSLHVEAIIKKLFKANMRISLEKSKFFQQEVEFLGFTVTEKGIKTCQDKVKDILNYELPKSLKSLRSFLGLSGYYRRFIKDYALIAKPLTKYLSGENGHVGAKKSKQLQISLDDEAIKAFEKLKLILASEDVLLQHPDYEKPFELTTDASSVALGAVLSQKGRPITMISRTLSKAEQNYATNERELLAIVWAIQKLRHYLYGVKNIHIFTDHQPLTFAISDKNPNPKIRRWRAFIDDYAPIFFYKPGRENKVADALSRQFVHALDQNISLDTYATCHSEISSSEFIKSIKAPVNQFKNQIILTESDNPGKTTKILFQKFVRNIIHFNNEQTLLTSLKSCVNPNVANAILCDLPTLVKIKDLLLTNFPGVKFLHTEKLVIDLTNKDDQIETATIEHNRAHRALQENFLQISSEYYFPNIKKTLQTIIANCRECRENKYQRNPPKPEVGKTPIPEKPGEILHIDVFSTGKQHFLTSIDKFTKFATIIPINSRATIDIKNALLLILNRFKNTKLLISDNEKAFQSAIISSMLKNHFNIEQFFVPPLHSKSNGQVERFHSTLLEIARCIKQNTTDITELLLLAATKYNNSIHSITQEKPIDTLHDFSEKHLQSIKSKLISAQECTLRRLNTTTRTFKEGDIVFVKRNKRLGNKLDKVYEQKVVQKDLGTTVLIDNKKIHKDNVH